MEITGILNDLITSLKVCGLYTIILFGSYAAGNETENSDIEVFDI
ncbi:MAG: nucleotidyltransferase domain-containing protein [Spirochaetales bacterium]|nr:nucleotidyltransferase domain-containing protein [Spirochaetales bacterium]